MISALLSYIEGLSAFIQSILGGAVFAAVLYLSRVALSFLRRTGSTAIRLFAKDMLLKHWVHKTYVSSTDPTLATLGHLFIVAESMRWFARAALILVFFFGVWALMNREWVFLLASYFSFNAFLEASRWLKNWAKDEEVAFISEEIKQEFNASLQKPVTQQALDQKKE